MKKWICLILALITSLSLSACKNVTSGAEADSETATSITEETAEPIIQTAGTTEAAAEDTATVAEVPEESVAADTEGTPVRAAF